MKLKKSIVIVTQTNPLDKVSWSGIHYQMYRSLSETFEVVEVAGPINKWVVKVFGVTNKITRLIFKKGYNHKNSIIVSYVLSKIFQKRLKRKKYDYILAPAASTEIAYLNTSIPIIYYTDSSFGQLNEYYDTYSSLFRFSVKESNYIEQKALLKASYYAYPSEWAKKYVEKNYQLNATPKVIPMGANIDNDQIEYVPKNIDKDQEINLLFLGVEWFRKGGDKVFDTFLLLSEKYNVNLTVCGCIPPVTHPKMKVIPFLNKNEASQMKRFTQLFQQTHLLFLPSKAECFGIVFCEASAFGVPSITTNTGGIPNAVVTGENGYCLDVNAVPSDYFVTISKLIENPTRYQELSKSSRELYLSTFNWNNWANCIVEMIKNN
jgi:glycosyltransferase involved in cell wall biosynthesis